MRFLIPFLLLSGAVYTDAERTDPPTAVAAKIVEASPTASAPVVVGEPLRLSAERFRWFKVSGHTGAITWEVGTDGIIGLQEFAAAAKLFGTVEGATTPTFSDIAQDAVVVWRKADGQVTLTAYGVVEGKAKRLDRITILCGPMPPPGPTPPGPGPTPAPSPVNPIPSDKLRTITIYETGKTYTAQQTGVMNSTIVFEYVKSVGGDWRLWGTKDDPSNEETFWKEAMKRPRTSLPWVIISSPKGFYEGPIAGTVADAVARLKLYGDK